MAYRLATMNNRAVLIHNDGLYDLERATDGAFSSDPIQAIARFTELHEVAAGLGGSPDAAYDGAALGLCVPRPQKVFGIGLNYRTHAEESGMEIPPKPFGFREVPELPCRPHR